MSKTAFVVVNCRTYDINAYKYQPAFDIFYKLNHM